MARAKAAWSWRYRRNLACPSNSLALANNQMTYNLSTRSSSRKRCLKNEGRLRNQRPRPPLVPPPPLEAILREPPENPPNDAEFMLGRLTPMLPLLRKLGLEL